MANQGIGFGKKLAILIAAAGFLAGAVWGTQCPVGDLDGDCVVGFGDVLVLAAGWLDDGCVEASCGDLDGIAGVGYGDFAMLVSHWGDQGSDVVITEIMASNRIALFDEDGASSDWIELYNGGNGPADISGWCLTDNAGELAKWRFPSMVLGAGEYAVVFASGKDRAVAGGELHTNFKLDSAGEYLALVKADGVTIAYEYAGGYGEQLTDISFGTARVANVELELFGQGDDVEVLVPDGDVGTAWMEAGFASGSDWDSGQMAIGYQMGGGADVLLVVNTAASGDEQAGNQAVADRLENVLGHNVTVVDDDASASGDATGKDLVIISSSVNSGAVGAKFRDVSAAVILWEHNLVDDFLLCSVVPTVAGQDSVRITTAGQGHPLAAGLSAGTYTVRASETTFHVGSDTNLAAGATVVAETVGGEPAILVVEDGDELNDGSSAAGMRVSVFYGDEGIFGMNQTGLTLFDSAVYYALYGESLLDVAEHIVMDVESEMAGVNSSAYVRCEFTAAAVSGYEGLVLRVRYDDGFVAYLNGVEVARRNAPASVSWDSAAAGSRGDSDVGSFEDIDITSFLGELVDGANVLAIHGLNAGADDREFLIEAELVAGSGVVEMDLYFDVPTPGALNGTGYLGLVGDTRFSADRGYYDAAFDVAIDCDTAGAAIYYTTDGSDPSVSNGDEYTGPVSISTTTVLRARAVKDGFISSNIDTQSYIFIADVMGQSRPSGYPTSWGEDQNGSTHPADYEMDPEIYDDPAYSGLIYDAMVALPAMSIVTDKDNLFAGDGIYMNTFEDGVDWERPTSVEMFDAAGVEEFQIDCGVRIYGAASRNPQRSPKHTFRLLFKGIYGDTKLRYPLFGEDGADEFDTIILRANYNNTWIHNDNLERARAQYMLDQWVRDTHLEMGKLASHGRFVHLYVNGLYWGVYNVSERPNGSFMASYLGGEREDYDALNGGDVIDGDRDAWETMMDMANDGLVDSGAYEAIQEWVDVDNMIDYMIINLFIGNQGWDLDHNWYAGRKREAGAGYKFFCWDSEDSTQFIDVDVSAINNDDNPTRVHHELRENADYRLRFADHVHKYFFNDGLLTPAANDAKWMGLADEIDLAIIAESARWGDYRRDVHRYWFSPFELYTRNDHWLVHQAWMRNSYFPVRSDIVLQQLKDDRLYPLFDAPVFSQHGGYVSAGFDLTMSAPDGGGMYYTLDGSDPKDGGGVVYSGPVELSESVNVRARVRDNGDWSALNEAVFAVGDAIGDLRITEIMYHPADAPVSDPDAEFIELKNVGTATLEIGLVKFSNGVDLTLPSMSLSPGEYVVVVKDEAVFESVYGSSVDVAGEYLGSLENAGERLRLEDAVGGTIHDFKYVDGWRTITDGGGYSLTIIDESNGDVASWADKASWRASTFVNGSPGQEDVGLLPNSVVINEVLAHSHAFEPDWIELHNTTGQTVSIGGWFLSDDDSDDASLMKYRIADGTTIGPGGYIVFYEDEHFGNVSDPGYIVPFALSENGETACLSSGLEGDVALTGYRDKETFGASATDIAFGRWENVTTGKWNFIAMSVNTPDAVNDEPPMVWDIVINEIMYNPPAPSGGSSYDNDDFEYVELHNWSDSTAYLEDIDGNPWRFTNGIDYTFPAGVSVPAGGFIVVVKDIGAFRQRYPSVPVGIIYGPYAGQLNNGGEKLDLSMPGDVNNSGVRQYIRVDRLDYSDGSNTDPYPTGFPGGADPWPTEPDGVNGAGASLERTSASIYGNDESNWSEGTPSPGEAN